MNTKWVAQTNVDRLYRGSIYNILKAGANELEQIVVNSHSDRTVVLIGEQHGSKLRQTFLDNSHLFSFLGELRDVRAG